MLFDKETRYWQEKYRNNEIPQEDLDDMCGETMAVLDGSAERSFTIVMRGFVVIIAAVLLWTIWIIATGRS